MENNTFSIKKMFSIIQMFFRNLFKSSSRKFIFLYVIVIFCGAILLNNSFSLSSNVKSNGEVFTFFDALFTSTSAFSNTGLVVTETARQFSFIGELIILFLIGIGGIGLMSIKVVFLSWITKKFFSRDLLLYDKVMLQKERGSVKVAEATSIIKTATITVLLATIIGAVLLLPYFYYFKQEFTFPAYQNFFQSLWYAIFHSTSAVNNAGFDIMGSQSLFHFSNDFYVQIIFILLIVLGGIGFPVLHDLRRYIKHKKVKNQNQFKWSLFTKITVSSYVIVFIIGLLGTFSIEIGSQNPNSLWNLASQGKTIDGIKITKSQVIMANIFLVFSTRNAGFATLPVTMFQKSTQFLWTFLMWIGSSPASTGGGIRTTTIAIAFLSIFAIFRGRESGKFNIFKRSIASKTIVKSFFILITSFILIIFAILAITITNNSLNVNAIFFEVTSAFGTTGLSTGITSSLKNSSLAILLVLMVIGQLGISAFFSIFAPIKPKKAVDKARYARAEVVLS